MTKSEFIDAIYQRANEEGADITKKDTNALFDLIFDTIAETVDDEERFLVPGFGTFELRHRKARKGRNPQTGEEIEIPASNTVGFRPSSNLKDLVNE